MSKEEKVLNEIQNQILNELDEEIKFCNENLNVEKARDSVGLLQIFKKMVGKLFFKLRIKITFYWGETELISYEIPKN